MSGDRAGETPLHAACRLGDFAQVKALLERGADKEAGLPGALYEGGGRTPLHVAARYGHADVAKVLLEAGANKDSTDKGNCTPLQLAIKEGSAGVVRELLKAGATLLSPDGRDPPLHLAAKGGHVDTVKAILEAAAAGGAVTTAASTMAGLQDKEGVTALHVAGNVDVATTLIAAGCSIEAVDKVGETPLFNAVQSAYTEVVRALLAAGASATKLDKTGSTPLHKAACFDEDGEVIGLLLAAGADPDARNERGYTPIHYAALSGNSTAAQALIETGCRLDVASPEGDTPIEIAYKEKGWAMMCALAERSSEASIAKVLWLALKEATKRPPRPNKSFNYGYDYEPCDLVTMTLDGKLPFLHLAARCGAPMAVEALLDLATQDEPFTRGNPPLPDTVLKLLDGTDEGGCTPLHRAAEAGKVEVAKALLRAGAQRDARNKAGFKPLQLAAARRHMDAVLALLEGASEGDMEEALAAGRTGLSSASSSEAEQQRLRLTRRLLDAWHGPGEDPAPLLAIKPDPEAPPPSSAAARYARAMADLDLDDSSVLDELVQRFMLPREGERHGETRSGAYRPKPVQLAAAAERNYPLLWPHLVRLREDADGAGGSSGGGGGESSGRAAAKHKLRQALRVLLEFESMAGAEPGPRDTALGRLLPAYAAAVAAAAGGAAAEDMAPADVVHLTAEEVDLEASGEGEGADEGARQAPKRRRVVVKQEPGV